MRLDATRKGRVIDLGSDPKVSMGNRTKSSTTVRISNSIRLQHVLWACCHADVALEGLPIQLSNPARSDAFWKHGCR
jgi:hypothetical protein